MSRIWLYFQVTIWSCVLFFLLIVYDPKKVMETMTAKKSKSGGPSEKAQVLECVQSVCRRNPLARRRPCLHRSLLSYRFLQSIGCSPMLNVGFVIKRFSQQEKEGIGDVHAWVAVDGQVVFDDTGYCIERYPHFLWTVSNIHYWASYEAVE